MNNPQMADILIVDDAPESLWLLLQLLGQAGYKVRPARDGRQALLAARLARPDLILLDVAMPTMNGYEVCEALKADEATRDIPVIFISGLNQVFDKVRAFSSGAVDYISKPFQNEEILARVKTHLTVSQLQKELQQRNIALQQQIAVRQQAELLLKESNDSLQQRLFELTILHFISQTLTTVSDIQAAVHTVVHIISHLFSAQAATVSIVDPVTKEMKVISSRNLPGSAFSAAPATTPHLPTESSPSAQLFSSVRKLFQTGGKTEGYLIVPLQIQDEVLGLLTLITGEPNHNFTETEEHLVETIADQIAGTVKMTQLFEEERRQRQLAESLRQVALNLNSSLDRSTVLSIIFEQLQRVLQYDGATVGLIEGDELVFVQTIGHTVWRVDDRLPLKSDNALVQVVQQRQVIVLANMAKTDLWPSWLRPNIAGSWMGAPLAVGRIVFGLLTIKRDQVEFYRQEDAKILLTFANQAALAIENARLYEQAQTVATDTERQRLARELHDSVTQSLYSLALLTNGWATLAQRGESDVTQMIRQFNQLEEISLQGLKEMRLLLHQLRPPHFGRGGAGGRLAATAGGGGASGECKDTFAG